MIYRLFDSIKNIITMYMAKGKTVPKKAVKKVVKAKKTMKAKKSK